MLIGAGFAYLQFSAQQQSARDPLISNQVSKGFEQLASENIRMRLGGIYGLEGVRAAPHSCAHQRHSPLLQSQRLGQQRRQRLTFVVAQRAQVHPPVGIVGVIPRLADAAVVDFLDRHEPHAAVVVMQQLASLICVNPSASVPSFLPKLYGRSSTARTSAGGRGGCGVAPRLLEVGTKAHERCTLIVAQ